MIATKVDIERTLQRISNASARRVDWIGTAFGEYADAITRNRIRSEALAGATSVLCDTWTENRFPPVAVLLAACREWDAAHRMAPERKSEPCPCCVATTGQFASGRLATQHESDCPFFDPQVEPFVTFGRSTNWKDYLRPADA